MKTNAFLYNSPFFAFLFSIATLTLLALPIQSCSIPLFEYALTYWPADPYEVLAFHRGTLSPEEQELVDRLQNAFRGNEFPANVIIKTVDLAESPGESIQKLWEAESEADLPWVIVRYPRYSMIPENAWSGQFIDANVEILLDSPKRREIARRILKGDVAAWVLLESGEQQKDEAAAKLLESQLKKMSETLKIIVPEFDADQYIEKELDVSFSLLNVSRSDPAEKAFVQMLLNSEWDLKTFSEPIAFPIFGRGRVLFALVGEGINEGNIEMSCSFLASWCSCQIKEQNPGVDLLMSVNWDNLINNKLFEEEPTLEAGAANEEIQPPVSDAADEKAPNPKSAPLDRKIQSPKISTLDAEEPSSKREPINQETQSLESAEAANDNPSNLKRNVLILVMAQVLGVAVVTCVILWRRRQR